MRGLPTELLFLLIFGAVLLFNIFTQQAARRRRTTARKEEERSTDPHSQPLKRQRETEARPENQWEAASEETRQDEPIEDFRRRLPETPERLPVLVVPAEQVARIERPIASSARRASRFSKQSLLETRQDMQNAIVIAMILGPCRALEPYGTAAGDANIGTARGRTAE